MYGCSKMITEGSDPDPFPGLVSSMTIACVVCVVTVTGRLSFADTSPVTRDGLSCVVAVAVAADVAALVNDDVSDEPIAAYAIRVEIFSFTSSCADASFISLLLSMFAANLVIASVSIVSLVSAC